MTETLKRESLFTPLFRGSYLFIWTPKVSEVSKKKDGTPSNVYSIEAIIDRSEWDTGMKPLREAVKQCLIDKHGSLDKVPAGWRNPFRLASTDLGPDGIPLGQKEFPMSFGKRPEIHNKYVLGLRCHNRAPGVAKHGLLVPPPLRKMNSKGQPAPAPIEKDSPELYAGAYYIASVVPYWYKNMGNYGVAFALNNLIKMADGDRLSGYAAAEDEFAEIDGAMYGLVDNSAEFHQDMQKAFDGLGI